MCRLKCKATSSSHIKIVYFRFESVIILKQNDIISACSQIQKQKLKKDICQINYFPPQEYQKCKILTCFSIQSPRLHYCISSWQAFTDHIYVSHHCKAAVPHTQARGKVRYSIWTLGYISLCCKDVSLQLLGVLL